ncbi:hypothetical protein BGZ65_005062 [Modicella reniformis]|uniref:Uncharacterized protein n=1 Tax=Modicella reniformis TaxID=1440133 RepID=A0A9P6M8N8_9FUNG|nr:hypothetical protein BGZ65_005062 [Modicella reniformis]
MIQRAAGPVELTSRAYSSSRYETLALSIPFTIAHRIIEGELLKMDSKDSLGLYLDGWSEKGNKSPMLCEKRRATKLLDKLQDRANACANDGLQRSTRRSRRPFIGLSKFTAFLHKQEWKLIRRFPTLAAALPVSPSSQVQAATPKTFCNLAEKQKAVYQPTLKFRRWLQQQKQTATEGTSQSDQDIESNNEAFQRTVVVGFL